MAMIVAGLEGRHFFPVVFLKCGKPSIYHLLCAIRPWLQILMIATIVSAPASCRHHETIIGGLMSSDLQSNAPSKSLEWGADSKTLSSDLGHKAFVFDEDEVVHLLRAAVEREGSQIAFADRYGVDRANVSAVLNGRRRINGSLVRALGLRRVYVVE
jgi:hypothetical protein